MYKKLCVALAGVCFFLIPFTVWSLWSKANGTEDVYVETTGAALIAETDIPSPSQELPETLSPMVGAVPLVPMKWNSGVFYDPQKARVYLPDDFKGSAPEIETSYFYNIHRITVEGKDWLFNRLYINDSMVHWIYILGGTITVYTKTGCFAEFTSDETGSYIQLTDPKTRYDAVVVIDPGHGGFDPGALGANGIYEKDINLNIADNLLRIFRNEKILLLPTRRSDVFITKDDRYKLANIMGDYFISIHCNADQFSASSHGIVTFYSPHEIDEPIASEELALTVQEELVAGLERRDRGVEVGKDYRVLNRSLIPAVLAEILFMTNQEELEIVSQPSNQMKIAEAFSRAIARLPLPRNIS